MAIKLVRIFKISTETATDGSPWRSYKVAAESADAAIKDVKRRFSKAIEERLLSIEMLASAQEE